jgi:hypothetical protein
MKPAPPRLTYANVVATVALFLAVGGGAAFAAGQIQSGDIAPGAVRSADIHKRAITSGKLAVGAVRGNQIADGALGSNQIKPGSIKPGSLQVPVKVVATATGGSQPLPSSGQVEYPLQGGTWTQESGEVDLVVAGVEGTLKYDGINAPPLCVAVIELFLNGEPLGSVQLNTPSISAQHVSRRITSGLVGRAGSATNTLTAKVSGISGCSESSIESLRVQVVGVG